MISNTELLKLNYYDFNEIFDIQALKKNSIINDFYPLFKISEIKNEEKLSIKSQLLDYVNPYNINKLSSLDSQDMFSSNEVINNIINKYFYKIFNYFIDKWISRWKLCVHSLLLHFKSEVFAKNVIFLDNIFLFDVNICKQFIFYKIRRYFILFYNINYIFILHCVL